MICPFQGFLQVKPLDLSHISSLIFTIFLLLIVSTSPSTTVHLYGRLNALIKRFPKKEKKLRIQGN